MSRIFDSPTQPLVDRWPESWFLRVKIGGNPRFVRFSHLVANFSPNLYKPYHDSFGITVYPKLTMDLSRLSDGWNDLFFMPRFFRWLRKYGEKISPLQLPSDGVYRSALEGRVRMPFAEKYRGFCFGYSMAAAETLFKGSSLTKGEIIPLATALRYTECDLYRVHGFLPNNPPPLWSQTQVNPQDYSLLVKKDCPLERLVENVPSTERRFCLLLRLWSLDKHSSLVPHAIMIQIDRDEKRYGFLDTNHRFYVHYATDSLFYRAFQSYLYAIYRDYYNVTVTWRWNVIAITVGL